MEESKMAFILENDVLKLECIEKGGEIQHLIKKSTNRETMYQGNQGWSGKNPTLFPMVGNTYTKEYEIDGKKYAMKNHGLIRYATLKGQNKENAIVFTLDADEKTLTQYPFLFHYPCVLLIFQRITSAGGVSPMWRTHCVTSSTACDYRQKQKR